MTGPHRADWTPLLVATVEDLLACPVREAGEGYRLVEIPESLIDECRHALAQVAAACKEQD